jgi:hypothetical protein
MLTQERLKEVLHYDPETGSFTWRVNKGTRGKIGAEAGNINSLSGYRIVFIDRQRYLCHRLAFVYLLGRFPECHTDHINGIRHDNRWCNLREVTPLINHKNQVIRKSNKSGVNGVCWLKKLGKWQAQIRVNYKTISLGLHDDKEDAINARLAANKKYGFHENHGQKNNNSTNIC